MGVNQNAAVTVTEDSLGVAGGELYVKQWLLPASGLAPLLLLHDSLGSVAQWRDFPAQLAAGLGRSVIAYDRLGFGRSTPRQDNIGAQFIVEEAAHIVPQLLAALQVESCIPFGHSVGGAMAIELAAGRSLTCQAVITESAQPYIEDQTLEGIRDAVQKMEAANQFSRLEKWHGDKARWVLNAWADTWLSAEFRDWSLDDCLSEVVCPVLALHGDKDVYGSVNFPAYIADAVAGPSQYKVFADCGHVPHRERTAALIRTTRGFLERHHVA